jgi:hypothetical protein
MHSFRWLRPLVCVGVLAAVAATGASSSLPAVRPMPLAIQQRHDPARDRKHRDDGTFQSSNWSGYALTEPNGSVTVAQGSWTVPTVSCSSGNQYSSFWVGIDGFNSSTVEQTGTDSDCNGATPVYYAWYEFYPHASFLINTSAIGNVGPGTLMTALVQFNASAGSYTVTLSNPAAGKSFSTSLKMSASRSSAEWIAEAPSSGGVLPIAQFAPAVFTASSATVSNSNNPLIAYFPASCPGGFNGACNPSATTGVQQVNLVQSSGATATPGNVGADSGFTVTVSTPVAPPPPPKKRHGKG